MIEPPITAAQHEQLEALSQSIDVLSSIFVEGSGTPTALAMCAATLRNTATMLDEITEAWLQAERTAAA